MKIRFLALIPALILAGCQTTISTSHQSASGAAGTPYTLPKGLVPVKVFADPDGVGITIEPAQTVIDAEVGTLVARFTPNAFNNEDLRIAADPTTGFLTTITTDSDAQLLAIVEEAAKSAGRLAFQNSRAAFLQQKVVVLDDSFDPLSKPDIDRINRGIDRGIRLAAQAFLGAQDEPITVSPVTLSVVHPDGSDPFAPKSTAQTGGTLVAAPRPEPLNPQDCAVGLCVRTLTSRIVRLEIGGVPFAGKPVNIPDRDLIPVPVPSTAFANQDILIEIDDGILSKNELRRESEVAGIAKVPGTALNGLVAGVTQGLTDKKSIIDKRKELADSEKAFAEAVKSREETMASQGTTSMSLQNATAETATKSDYATATLTVYPFSESLTRALKEAIAAAKAAKTSSEPNEDSSATGDILDGGSG